MKGILIKKRDFELFGNKDILKKIGINNTPKTDKDIGIILIIPEDQFNILNNKKDGLYINSSIFIKNIKNSYCIVYDKNRKIIEIVDYINNYNNLNIVLETIHNYAPEDTFIWSGVISKTNCNNYIKSGFDNPYIPNTTPILKRKCDYGVAFFKYNKAQNINRRTINNVNNKLKYIYGQTKKKCTINIQFIQKTITYLQNLNNTLSYREQAGALVVGNVTDDIVFQLYPLQDSVMSGAEQEVDAVWSRYNFHTHPKKAYELNNVKRGWPSSQDFVGFSQLNSHTIFHTVVTLEGIYIISFNPEWDKKITKIDHKWIRKYYHIDHKTNISFEEYTNRINNIKPYKNTGKRIFNVKYMSWKNATKPFSVYYSKTNNKCLATEDSFQLSSKYDSD